ncbi:hypothetical protein V5799_010369, partial [Amblyomma americanum]
PLVSSDWVVEELKPFQLPGAVARNQSSRVPAIPSSASPVPHVRPENGRPHPVVEPASRDVWRVEEDMPTEEYYRLKPAYFSKETWRKLPDDIKKRYGKDDKDGSITERKGASTGEEEPTDVEPIEVRRCAEFFVVDGRQQEHNHWMNNVNYSPSKRRQNLVALLFNGDIYYRTLRNVGPGEELLVGYSTSFTESLLANPRGRGALKEREQKLILHCLNSW